MFLVFSVQTFAQNDQPGIFLQGNPNDNARSHLVSRNGCPVSNSMISKDGLIKTRLEAVISPKATVKQVNEALKSVGASIATMLPGTMSVSLVIPAVSGVDQAREIAKKLVTSGAFHTVEPAYSPSVN